MVSAFSLVNKISPFFTVVLLISNSNPNKSLISSLVIWAALYKLSSWTIIPGQNSVALDSNHVPTTVPTIQEWNGATGTYQLTNNSRDRKSVV